MEYLKTYGFDPGCEALRLKSLTLEEQSSVFRRNIAAYNNEVVENQAVSIPYHYYFNSDGEIFTDPSLKPIFNLELQIDKREREGLPLVGIKRALNLARDNPDKLVALYSPEGPASFSDDPNNPFNGINYDYGQLYLLDYDREKVKALAIKIKDEGKEWIGELLADKFGHAGKHETEETKTYIQTPVLIMPPDEFFNKDWRKDYIIYENEKRKYYLMSVLNTIRESFREEDAREILPNYDSFTTRRSDQMGYDGMTGEISEESIFRAYLSVIYRFLEQNGGISLALSGSCGGSVVTMDRVEMILGIKNTVDNNPLFQLLSGFASVPRALFKIDGDGLREGSCVNCGKRTMVGNCGWCKGCADNDRQNSEKSKYN